MKAMEKQILYKNARLSQWDLSNSFYFIAKFLVYEENRATHPFFWQMKVV